MIYNKYSRLNRIREVQTRWQILAVSGLAVGLLILIVKIGIPALLGFSTSLANLRRVNPDASAETSLAIPNTPSLEAPYPATNTATIRLTGQAEPDYTVVIFRNGLEVTSKTVGADGSFEHQADLLLGSNVFIAKALNEKGKESAPSPHLDILYQTTPPKLEVSSPKDGESFAQDAIDVIGLTDIGSAISVNDRAAVVGSDGTFRYFYRLQGGDNKIVVAATDRAGNSTKVEMMVKRS